MQRCDIGGSESSIASTKYIFEVRGWHLSCGHVETHEFESQIRKFQVFPF